MINLFDITMLGGERLALINIATGVLAPSDVSLSLLGAYDTRVSIRHTFINEELLTRTKDFWDPVKKTNTKTSASFRKPIKVAKDKM